MYTATQNNINSGDMNIVASYNAPPKLNMVYNSVKEDTNKISATLSKHRSGIPVVVPQEPLIQRDTVSTKPLKESVEDNQKQFLSRPLANKKRNSSDHRRGLCTWSPIHITF